MMYRAKVTFRDLQDGHLYKAGETFPFDGREVPQERIDALVTGRNASSMALLEEVEEIIKEEPKKRETGRRTARKAK